ncbi:MULTISPECIES: SDR family oxidoreductase [unclassified Nodularia (in: cyanobacteria)]|uniref:SDR family oxidoreductase n=1 Tax=unclassified Nodularia (in: cyanobacteria) TaxID=2656917 RepID=UPI0018828785|nr:MULTISPECIES: SDR family oxidoreductase [unclassified Nodularia (in: cyanobacteria)]MBE9197869.1 SDR family oxidoreductase [Nodularia sp. LEGE 06071]MCC2694605.1 SDR family oxidoreductase [Nodularia sp. LEGE 04288]
MSKTVLITGASSGIGEATAKYFLQQGWNVAATMRSPRKTDNWAKGKNIIYPLLDVTKPETISAAIRETLEHFGHIEVLVNNAGYALMGPIEGVTSEQLEHQFQTNFFGLVSTIQTLLPVFRQQGRGTIINVSSIGGRLAFPLTSSYHATKWAVEGLSESIRYELRPFGIRVKIIEPGGIKTNFINHGTTWAKHPDYTEMVNRMKQFSEKVNDSLPEPEGVAKTIYRAATDGTQRLRYSPYGEVFFFLHAILPDRLWRSLVGNMMLGKMK